MIDPKELHIDNWVALKGIPMMAHTSMLKHLLYAPQLADPIPITEEWLLKLGFSKHSDHETVVNYHINGWALTLAKKTDAIMKEGVWYHGLDFIPVEYVHQLQNLFYWTTRKELRVVK